MGVNYMYCTIERCNVSVHYREGPYLFSQAYTSCVLETNVVYAAWFVMFQ